MAFAAPLIPLLPTILGVAGAGVAGINAIQQGNYQAAVLRNNAIIAEQNANAESRRSQTEQVRSDREYATMLGEQMATQAASGLDILGRSQLMTRNVTMGVGREAAGDIRSEGTAAARRLLQDSANFRAEGKAAKRQGVVSGIGSFLQAGSMVSKEMGRTSSLATSRTNAGRRPRGSKPNWYGGR
jgi:hypothetical protein